MQVDPFQTPWTTARILQLLYTQDKAVERALLSLYQRQEPDEQAARETLKKNDVGFNAADARTLSNYAKIVSLGGTLPPEQMKEARQRVLKYAGQLLSIALAKQTEKDLQALSQ
jgi:hypothetical protein